MIFIVNLFFKQWVYILCFFLWFINSLFCSCFKYEMSSNFGYICVCVCTCRRDSVEGEGKREFAKTISKILLIEISLFWKLTKFYKYSRLAQLWFLNVGIADPLQRNFLYSPTSNWLTAGHSGHVTYPHVPGGGGEFEIFLPFFASWCTCCWWY